MKIVKIILIGLGLYALYYIVGIIYFFISLSPGGGLGGFPHKKFETDIFTLENTIDCMLESDSSFAVPEKWKKIENEWQERGYDFLNTRIFYFPNPPEEMYYVSFIGYDTAKPGSKYSEISIRSVGNKNGWKSYKSFDDDDEIERIESRFDSLVVTKVKLLLTPKF